MSTVKSEVEEISHYTVSCFSNSAEKQSEEVMQVFCEDDDD